MKLLLDTHVLLWAAGNPEKLSAETRVLLEDSDNTLYFSAASFWEIAIKLGLGRDDFDVDPRLLRRGLVDNGYEEIPVRSEHTLFLAHLPSLHKDPFDRILVAQANLEGVELLTADAVVVSYPGPIRRA